MCDLEVMMFFSFGLYYWFDTLRSKLVLSFKTYRLGFV